MNEKFNKKLVIEKPIYVEKKKHPGLVIFIIILILLIAFLALEYLGYIDYLEML